MKNAIKKYLFRFFIYEFFIMKKIKKSKKENIQNFLHSLEKLSEPSISLIEQPKNNEFFSHQWKILNDHFLQSKYFYMIKPPEKSTKYEFMSSKFSRNNRDQICDQVF